MNCLGCYKKNTEGYCASCRRLLFDGAKVSHVLDFDEPKAENRELYDEKTKKLSISGVQLKYSLRLDDRKLILTETNGQYILKPPPPTTTIEIPRQAPENEHLTMQIARQIYDIPVAVNGLILFHDGVPAYITRRFDRKKDGTKFLQEDFAQIADQSSNTHGDNYKYEGTYEDIGNLIREKVPAWPVVLEEYFKLVVFNYLFSNGDAHLKNFSLIESGQGDYLLAPAYDLMTTVLHIPHDTDAALQLYPQHTFNRFWAKHGFYGRPHFEEFSEKIGMVSKRVKVILDKFTEKTAEVHNMVEGSFLSDDAKEKYVHAYESKVEKLTVGF